jgi:hypothetical protein
MRPSRGGGGRGKRGGGKCKLKFSAGAMAAAGVRAGGKGGCGGGGKRSPREKINDAKNNPDDWTPGRRSEAPSTNKRNRGGRSRETEFTHKDSGEKLWYHELFKKDGSFFEPPHFRDYAKQLRYK